MIPRRPIWRRRRRKIKASWWRRHNRGKGSYTQVEFQLTLLVGSCSAVLGWLSFMNQYLTFLYWFLLQTFAWGLLPLKLRSYIFRLESRKAEDREVYTCTHEHSWKRGSHESKVSIPPSVPNLEIIKFTFFFLPLLLATTDPKKCRTARATDSRWTSPKAWRHFQAHTYHLCHANYPISKK